MARQRIKSRAPKMRRGTCRLRGFESVLFALTRNGGSRPCRQARKSASSCAKRRAERPKGGKMIDALRAPYGALLLRGSMGGLFILHGLYLKTMEIGRASCRERV